METNPRIPFLHFSFLLLTLSHLIISNTATGFNDTAEEVPLSTSSLCHGSIAECSQDLEMVMESETSRRVLAEQRRKYISPGALKRDQPVCNGGGAGEPYSRGSGCLPQPSRPYNRGCSRYYRCRSDV